MKYLSLLTMLAGLQAAAQGIPIKSGKASTPATVNANKAVLMSKGKPSNATFSVVLRDAATTALFNLTVEAGASVGYKLAGWCVTISNATAAAAVTVDVVRRSSASSGGTLCVVDTNTTCSISTIDPGNTGFQGIARTTSTLGAGQGVLDSVGFQIGETGAGTTDPPGFPVYCRYYGLQGEKMPTVAAGTANGISINVGSSGLGGRLAGDIVMYIIQQ